jgi:hypothetical protein
MKCYCKAVKSWVDVIGSDGDKFLRFIHDGKERFEKGCEFSNRVFTQQEKIDHKYASRLMRGKRKGVPILTGFWR